MRDKQVIGVLVMSYGTPESMDQIEAYYTHIRRGRPPSPEQLHDLTERYRAIGGTFPLRENTNRQVAALEAELNREQSDKRFVCYQGLKHANPLIEDGVQRMAQDGIKKAVGIVLAPHYSVMSVGSYIDRARKAAEEHGIEISFVESYHLHPKLIQAWANRVEKGLSQFTDVARDDIRVIYSAHSLPSRILKMNDPYPDQLLATSRAISEQVDVTNWQFAWQSAGQTHEEWLGPDILDVIREEKEKDGARHILISPIGFVSDHLEILYDIDIECVGLAKELGIELKRTESLNTDPLYIETLADCIRQQL